MDYAFGGFTLDLTRGELRGPDGPVALEPRAFVLLTHMIENAGRLVDKDELVAEVWDGRIVSDAAISTAIKAARRALGDDGTGQAWLKTVRGRGFRFEGDVTTVDGPGASEVAPAMALLERPAVLIVGFDCLARDGQDASLAQGLAQEVRLNLSHWRWMPVIGPEAVGFKTAGEIDVRQTARDLGAAYALTGAVRAMGERVRVNVTLTEIAEGKSIWSHHFDGTLENLFDFEEEASRAIVAQVEPELSRANSQRLTQTRPNDLSAWQILLQAGDVERRAGQGYGTKEGNREQIALLQKALDKDPEMARAWAWLAKCHWRDLIMSWTEDREATIQATLAASEKGLALNTANWEARCFRALALLFGRREFVEAEYHAREAVRLNPSDTTARHGLGCVLENVGKTEESLEHLNAVFRLNPNHANTAGVMGDIVTCEMLLGRDANATEAASRLIALAPTYARGLQRAIAAFAQAGDMDRAHEAVARLHALQPDFDEAYVRETYPFRDGATLDRFVSALASAGAFRPAA